MREHSGAEGKNNNRNPKLRDAKQASERSGEALLKRKHDDKTPSRQGTAGSD